MHPFSECTVKLIVCNVDNVCSEANTTLMSFQRVSMCEVFVEQFTEYEFVSEL